VLVTANESFERALDVVQPIAASIHKIVQKMTERPAEFTMKFGLKFTGQAGAIIASTSVEGACEITIKWAK
jgi:NTP-dependent ternary system trypsin peptidase co-occuring protein